MATIFNSAILDSAILHKTLTQTGSIWLKLIHSDSTWWRQPSWALPSWQPSSILSSLILPSWIQPFCTKRTSLIHSDSTWWLQLCWNLPSLIQPFCTKRTSFIHSHSTWWWQPSWILPLWIQLFCTKKNFTHSFWLNFMMAAILNSANMDSAILHKTLTETSSIWLKLIHCHSTWWWQPFWILPFWFQTVPSWIQTSCYLISDSLKNTLPQLWPWLKLIQSD